MSALNTNDPERCSLAMEALREVIDPEIGLNIVDLGLVYQIDFLDEEKQIDLKMTLTTQFCPMGDAITSSASEAMEAAFPAYTIVLNLVFEPHWEPAMISDEGHQFLNA